MVIITIFFTQYAVHIVFNVPDLTLLTDLESFGYADAQAKALQFSAVCFTLFNFVCFLAALPIGRLATKFGNKQVHGANLLITAAAFLTMVFNHNPAVVMTAAGVAGIGWASAMSLPFAMMAEFMKRGAEGTALGIYSVFASAPQIILIPVLSGLVALCTMQTDGFLNYHWEYIFAAGAVILITSACIGFSLKVRHSN